VKLFLPPEQAITMRNHPSYRHEHNQYRRLSIAALIAAFCLSCLALVSPVRDQPAPYSSSVQAPQ